MRLQANCPPAATPSNTAVEQQRLQHATPRRSIHEVPPITNHGSKFAEFGVPELLSAKGYKTAWTDYQQLIVDRLNEKVAGTPPPISYSAAVNWVRCHALTLDINLQAPLSRMTKRGLSSCKPPVSRSSPPPSTMPRWPSTTTSSSKPSYVALRQPPLHPLSRAHSSVASPS